MVRGVGLEAGKRKWCAIGLTCVIAVGQRECAAKLLERLGSSADRVVSYVVRRLKVRSQCASGPGVGWLAHRQGSAPVASALPHL